MIRRIGIVLLAVLLQVGLSVVSFAGPASAQTATACTASSGTVTLVPGWSPTGPREMQQVTVEGSLGDCTGSVSSGTVAAHLMSTFSESCDTLTQPTEARGTGKLEWNTGTPSKLKSDFAMYESGMSAKFTGTITGGQFSGLALETTFTLTPTSGNCTTTTLTHLSYVGTAKIK
jgi:hypothetical protein